MWENTICALFISPFQNSVHHYHQLLLNHADCLYIRSNKKWSEVNDKKYPTSMATCTEKIANTWYTSIILNWTNYCIMQWHTGRPPVPQEYINVDLSDETTSIAYLIPKTTGRGCCTTALVNHLVMIHNEFIDICMRIIREMRATGRTWCVCLYVCVCLSLSVHACVCVSQYIS